MKYWQLVITSCLIFVLTACGGSSGSGSDGSAGSGVTVEEISFSGITLSMNEGVVVGTLVEQQLVIGNGPIDISNITLALSGAGSEYFSVAIIAGESPGDYLGNLSLTQSLLGLAGSDLKFTATVSAGDQSLSVPVVIQLTELVKTLEAYQHGDIYNKGQSRLSTGESQSGLTIAVQPLHGTVNAYYVGNEFWSFEYTSSDCFEGQDSYLYKIDHEYGEVTVNVEAVLQDLTISAETGTTKIIDLTADLPVNFSETITVTQPAHGTSSYSPATKRLTYTPNSSVISDSFTYAVNDCAKTVTANVSRGFTLLGLNTAETGQELWKTDGTVAGTELVKDMNLGVNGSFPNSFIKRPSDGMYFFEAKINGNNSVWKTDGTAGNTLLIKEFDDTEQSASRSLGDLLLVGEDIYLMSKTDTNSYLWKTDGQVMELVTPMSVTGGADASGYMHTINGKVVFAKDTSAPGPGTEPWVSDGTAVGTGLLNNIWPGSGGSNFMKGGVIEFKGKLFSRADDYTHGSEIWMTDGTASETKMLINLEPETAGNREGSIPTRFTSADDVFYFAAVTSDKGDQLWKSDGTAANTEAVKDMNPNSSARDQDLFSGDFFYGHIKQDNDINGLLFFAAKNGEFGTELWKSDGTEAGTVMVKDLMPGLKYSSRPGDFVELDNVLYFAAYALDNTRNLWRSDGTEQGTVMVKSFAADELQPGGIEVKEGIMFLTIRKGNPDEGGFDHQLWRSDGTAAGTYFLWDIK